MPRRSLVWPLRVASQVGDPSIARRAHWTVPPLTLVAESLSHALAKSLVHGDQTLARPLARDFVSGLGLVCTREVAGVVPHGRIAPGLGDIRLILALH
jgi:hypothetical protein